MSSKDAAHFFCCIEEVLSETGGIDFFMGDVIYESDKRKKQIALRLLAQRKPHTNPRTIMPPMERLNVTKTHAMIGAWKYKYAQPMRIDFNTARRIRGAAAGAPAGRPAK